MKRILRLRILLLLALLASLLPLQAVQAADTWTLTGRLTDTKGNPVSEGATINFRYDDGSQQPPGGMIMDSQGYFRIYPQLGKPGTLVIQGRTWLPIEDHFSARTSSREETWNYTLHHNYWILQGTITEYKTGKPVVGMQMHFTLDKDGSTAGTSYTDNSGHYIMQLPVNESGTLYNSPTHSTGWKTLSDHFNPRGSEKDETWNYTIHPRVEHFELTGQVTDQNKTPLPQMTVSIQYDGENKISTYSVTDMNGHYHLEPETDRPFTLIIANGLALNWLKTTDHFNPRHDSKAKETWDYIAHRNYWTLKGQVKDEHGRPLPGAYVAFHYDEGWTPPADFNHQTNMDIVTHTDSNGCFAVYPLLTRSGTLIITAPYWQNIEDHFNARGSEREETWNYTLQRQ